MSHSLRRIPLRPLWRRAVIAAATLVVTAAAGGASAATVTKTGLAAGIPGFPTQPGGLGIFEALTPVPPPDAVREVGTYAVTVAADPAIATETPFAGTWRAYGVTDVRNHTDTGVAYPMELQVAADAWAGEFQGDVPATLTWLLRHADGLVAAESDPQRAAAAVQVVVWQTLRNPQSGLLPRADLVTPTDDPAVNALAEKFAGAAAAGAASLAQATVAVSAGPLTGCAATLTLAGTPGVPVSLRVDNGGVLTTSVVVIGSGGTAQAQVSGVTGATVTVTAAVATGGVLVRADGDHDPDAHSTEGNSSRAPEELIFLAGAASAVSSTPITCGAPPVAPPVATPPIVTPVGVSVGVLQLTKAAPPSAVAGRRITYRLRVRNTSTVPVTAVVLRDVLPSGMTLVARPKGATLKNGIVTWQLGTLAPGAQRVVTLTVRLDRTIAGQRCNTADASAGNAPTVRVRACSNVRAVAGVTRLPGVTG